MNDLARLNGRPRTIAAGGESRDIHPLTLADLGDLQAWLDSQQPDPLAIARAEIASGEYSLAQQQFLLRTAMEIRTRPRPRLGSPEADVLLDSIEGRREILYLCVRRGAPGFTRDDAARFLQKLSDLETADALAQSEVGLVSDPKAPSSTGPASATARSASGSTGGGSTTS